MTETTDGWSNDALATEGDDIVIDLGEIPTEDEIEIDLDFGGPDEPTPEDDIVIDLSEPEEPEPVTTPLGQLDDEVDPEIEAALELLRQELRSKVGDWYVVHTYSGMENRVKQNLDFRVKTLNMEDYIYETVVPTEDVIEMRNGARKTVTRVVLPGYVLVRMNMTDDSWAAVRHTPSVTGFVGHANDPVPLELGEVERMLTPSVVAKVNAAHAGKPARGRKRVEVVDYLVGDSVQVIEGPFAGVHATITEINTHNQRVKANVEILGRETPVDLTFPQIQKVV
ncbi:MAG: transcription termination/antitermination protein NusG [Propionibacteriaceae bacterium]|nr:transcription termination/antitermination protein NusG [Propionibacteriaceae bacterium]